MTQAGLFLLAICTVAFQDGFAQQTGNQCLTAPSVEHGSVHPTDDPSVQTFSCDPDYVARGNIKVYCSLGGQWVFGGFCDFQPTTTTKKPTTTTKKPTTTTKKPTTTTKTTKCLTAPRVEHGSVHPTSDPSVQTFSCDPDYTPMGNINVTCSKEGYWVFGGFCYFQPTTTTKKPTTTTRRTTTTRPTTTTRTTTTTTPTTTTRTPSTYQQCTSSFGTTTCRETCAADETASTKTYNNAVDCNQCRFWPKLDQVSIPLPAFKSWTRVWAAFNTTDPQMYALVFALTKSASDTSSFFYAWSDASGIGKFEMIIPPGSFNLFLQNNGGVRNVQLCYYTAPVTTVADCSSFTIPPPTFAPEYYFFTCQMSLPTTDSGAAGVYWSQSLANAISVNDFHTLPPGGTLATSPSAFTKYGVKPVGQTNKAFVTITPLTGFHKLSLPYTLQATAMH